jgi:hypothetical protein
MKRIAISVLAVLAVCAVPILIARPLQAAPPATHVLVVNGAGQAVPVAVGGPVSIAGTVPVSVGAPISVAGTVLTAPANNPTPFSHIAILSLAAGGRQDLETIYTVPAGKRLMIQSETAVVQTTGGVKAQVTISAIGLDFYAVLPQIDRGFFDGQGEMFEGSSAVPMSVEAGQAVQAQIWLSSQTVGGTARAEIGFSGYLVDVP